MFGLLVALLVLGLEYLYAAVIFTQYEEPESQEGHCQSADYAQHQRFYRRALKVAALNKLTIQERRVVNRKRVLFNVLALFSFVCLCLAEFYQYPDLFADFSMLSMSLLVVTSTEVILILQTLFEVIQRLKHARNMDLSELVGNLEGSHGSRRNGELSCIDGPSSSFTPSENLATSGPHEIGVGAAITGNMNDSKQKAWNALRANKESYSEHAFTSISYVSH